MATNVMMPAIGLKIMFKFPSKNFAIYIGRLPLTL